MRRLSTLFTKQHPTYKRMNDDDSSSGSGSPRKAKSSEWTTVNLTEVFPQPRKQAKSRPPRAPANLKKKNPGASATRREERPLAPSLSGEAAKLFKVLGVKEEEARALLQSHVPLARAILGRTIWTVEGELSLKPASAFNIFESLTQADTAVACRFLALLHKDTLHNTVQMAPPGRVRTLLEQVAQTTDDETGLDLDIVQTKLVALAKTFISVSKPTNPVGLDLVLNICPSWALPAVLETILAVDSNPDPLSGSPSLIDAWCKDEQFADALRDAHLRYTALVD